MFPGTNPTLFFSVFRVPKKAQPSPSSKTVLAAPKHAVPKNLTVTGPEQPIGSKQPSRTELPLRPKQTMKELREAEQAWEVTSREAIEALAAEVTTREAV